MARVNVETLKMDQCLVRAVDTDGVVHDEGPRQWIHVLVDDRLLIAMHQWICGFRVFPHPPFGQYVPHAQQLN